MKKIIAVFTAVLLVSGSFAGCTGSAKASGFDVSKSISVISREDGSGTRGAFIELFGVEESSDDGAKTDKTTKEANIAAALRHHARDARRSLQLVMIN